MTVTRRHFLQQTATLAAGMALWRPGLHDLFKKKHLVGLQLYSVREDMKKAPLQTLEQLAKMGYKYVEHANYQQRKFYGWTAKEFKEVLRNLGMKMPSGHTSLLASHWDATKKDFTDAWKQTVEDAAICDQEFVISPWMEAAQYKTADTLKQFMDIFNKCGELCKRSGMRFGYHNHDFEFSVKLGDKTVYDLILEYTDPSLVIQQLDTGNLYHTGARADELIRKYPGRFISLHVKDEIKSAKGEMGSSYESTVLGAGVVGVENVLQLALNGGGARHLIVEQESYQEKTPLECMKENLRIMKNWGY